jgi:class 3 adenylate cyclase
MGEHSATVNGARRIDSSLVPALNRWLDIPAGTTRRERRSYDMAIMAMPFGLIYHFLFIFLFAYWGIPVLAVANVLSVLLWSASVVLLRKHKLDLAIAIIAFEIIAHGALVIYIVGWGMGVQYYLVTSMLGVIAVHWSLGKRLSIALFLIALFILYYYYALGNAPRAAVDLVQLNIVNIIVTSSAFLASAAGTLYSANIADRAEAELEREHEKSEALLNNILPEAISARLKEGKGKGTIADYCEGASILFADVVDFTPMSAKMTPVELVDLLNDVFSDFDALTGKFELEKIKTIGDCYMVASGVPRRRADHAQVLTRVALEMQEHASKYEFGGQQLAFRIGINSGPVVAGVIGRKKFIYDLWGDAVNTASRMESNGKGGCVQITEATYELIKDDFICEPKGRIQVKGKGEMDIWHVLRVRS